MNFKEPKVEQSEQSIPQPLECFRNPPVPPFLSKTYDLVDDSSLDPIISWSPGGTSFVVWDPVEFSRSVLPKHFKHNNFSSFVRQLNTYGFHKIGTDKWEFANEDFMRGHRTRLKHISRRRTSQVHQSSSQTLTSSSAGMANPRLVEDEITKLKQEKETLMQEVFQLKQQNVQNVERLESLNHRISSAEERQKQMVSFLAKVLNPTFISHLKRLKAQKSIEYATRAKRKFLKHCTSSFSSSSAITLSDTTESDNEKQKQVSDDLLKNLNNDKGKSIAKEMEVSDPIFSASEDDYLLSLPENIMINSENEVERGVHGRFVGPEATSAMNEDCVNEGWEGMIDVGAGENYLCDNAAWDMNIGGYSNDQDSLWDVGLNTAEEDLDIDRYIAGASLLEEFRMGAQQNQDLKP